MTKKFTTQELAFYARHLNLDEVGMAGQERLKAASVLYIGAGGLGSAALHYLAAAGVGTLGIIDHDVVDVSNLHRQILYSHEDVGKKKVLIAQNRLNRLNPHINIIPYDQKLTHLNALEIVSQYDIIADGSDNFATRYLVNDACFHLKKPNVYASILQFTGQCTIFTYKNQVCYRCLFDEPPPKEVIPNCAEGGVLGVLPGILGSIQAAEIIKLILEKGELLVNRLLMFDALKMSFREMQLQQNPYCRLCHSQQPFNTLPHHESLSCDMPVLSAISSQELASMLQQQADFILLDVREEHEYEVFNLNGKLIPLGQLPERMYELDKNKLIIVHCKYEGRSQKACQLLNANGFTTRYLAGGIMRWMAEINSQLLVY